MVVDALANASDTLAQRVTNPGVLSGGVSFDTVSQNVRVDARDAVWAHPDLLPTSSDLDEPAGFIDRVIGGDISGIDIDAAIAEFQKETDPGREDPPVES